MLFGMLLLVFLLDDYTGNRMVDYFQSTMGHADEIEISVSHLPSIIKENVIALLLILAPYLIASTIIVLIVNFAQVGFVFTTKPLEPELSKINPGKGFQRIFSMKSVFELAKNLLKLILVGVVAGSILNKMWPGLLTAISMSPFTAIDLAANTGMRIALFCTALLLILAIIDYVYQKFEFEKSIRMSKQEIKDEYKNQEGDPQIKRRIREMGRRIAMSRMFEQLAEADAVITNPTHYAVAVSYELDWPAPKVVAKGTDYLAKRIIRYAEEQDVPVYQQPDLARALYKTEIDNFVPANLFKAVAKVLAHLSKLDPKLRAKLGGVKQSAGTRVGSK